MKNFLFGDGGIYTGLMIISIGILLLLSAILNADWLFSNTGTFNINKIAGWVDFFGRKTARVMVGLLSIPVIAFDIFWIWYILANK